MLGGLYSPRDESEAAMHDLILAVLHHILVFGLLGLLLTERALLAADRIDIRRLARLDARAGMASAAVLAIGIGRVLGGKGWAFYDGNPFFWAKLATFFLIGAISVRPTLLFLRWARAERADGGFQPLATEVATARRFLGIMAMLFIPLLGFAAAMARWPF